MCESEMIQFIKSERNSKVKNEVFEFCKMGFLVERKLCFIYKKYSVLDGVRALLFVTRFI